MRCGSTRPSSCPPGATAWASRARSARSSSARVLVGRWPGHQRPVRAFVAATGSRSPPTSPLASRRPAARRPPGDRPALRRRRGVLRLGSRRARQARAAADAATNGRRSPAARTAAPWPWGDSFDARPLRLRRERLGLDRARDRAPRGRRPVRRRAARRQRLGVGRRPHARRLGRRARRLVPRPRWGVRASRALPADPGARDRHHRLPASPSTPTPSRRSTHDRRTAPDRTALIDALGDVYDPCCADRGISIVDMGVVEDVRIDGSHVSVDLVLDHGLVPVRGVACRARSRTACAARRRRDRRRPRRVGSRLDDGSPVASRRARSSRCRSTSWSPTASAASPQTEGA